MQRIKDFWNKNKTSKILLIIGGLTVICFACLVLGILLPESEDSDIDSTATNEPAIATDVPTAENVITPSPEDALDEPKKEVEEYYTEQSIAGLMCSTSLGTMSEKFIEAGENVELLNDSNYLADMFAAIDDFELYCTNFYDENAPVEVTEINNMLKEVDENYIQAAVYTRSGLANLNTDDLDSAGYYLTTGNEKMSEVNRLLDEMN